MTSYVTANSVQDIGRLYSEDFDIITDVILFGCASFDSTGEVNIQKNALEKALSNLRAVLFATLGYLFHAPSFSFEGDSSIITPKPLSAVFLQNAMPRLLLL